MYSTFLMLRVQILEKNVSKLYLLRAAFWLQLTTSFRIQCSCNLSNIGQLLTAKRSDLSSKSSPSKMRMTRVLNDDANPLPLRPFQRRGDDFCRGRINHIVWVSTQGTSLDSCIWVPRNTCSVGESGRAGIVRKEGIVDTDRVLAVECRVPPLITDGAAGGLVVIGLGLVAD